MSRRGLWVYHYAIESGALLRPLGDVIYFIPPYVIKTDEIDWLAKVAGGLIVPRPDIQDG